MIVELDPEVFMSTADDRRFCYLVFRSQRVKGQEMIVELYGTESLIECNTVMARMRRKPGKTEHAFRQRIN